MSAPRRRALACALLVLAAGCSDAPPTAPPSSPAPPAVKSVAPPARATGVVYDTGIVVEFVPALNPVSIDSTTVFMKLDTARYPISLAYDAATRTLHIAPRFRVQLKRTYTVEITPRVLTTTGTSAVPGGYFWQFTTNTVRRPLPIAPVDAITYESPHTRLGWDITEDSGGSVNYDVYVSEDSLALAAGTVPKLARTTRPYFIPNLPWGFDRRLYWRVDAVNLVSGESLSGHISRFTTLPANTPIDSTIAPLDRWGYFRRNTGATACMPGSMASNGPGDVNGAMRWNFTAAPQPLRLAWAHLELQTNSLNWAPRQPAIYFTKSPWSSCSQLGPVEPQTEVTGQLAAAVMGYGVDWVKYQGDYFTAYIEATARYNDTGALQLVASSALTYGTSIPTDRYRGAMMLYYYKLPPAAAAGAPR